MAKRRNIADKLKKKEELPKKVSFAPAPKNFEAVAKQADSIHKHEEKPAIREATPPKKQKTTKEVTARLNLVLNKNLIKEIKRKALDMDMTLKEYITSLVKKDLGKK